LADSVGPVSFDGQALVSVQVMAGALRSWVSLNSLIVTLRDAGKVDPPSRTSLRQSHSAVLPVMPRFN